MKRKVWNKSIVPDTRSTGCWLRINPKSGGIVFSNDLAAKLKVDTMGVNFIQDEDKPGDWFIEASKDAEAFQIRKKGKPVQFIMQSTFLAREILKSSALEMESHKFIVGAEPVEKSLYAIITKSAKSTTRKAA